MILLSEYIKAMQAVLNKSKTVKRFIDLFFSSIGIIITIVPMMFLIIVASISTKSFGIFKQIRVGEQGIPFHIFKIRSMKIHQSENTFTANNDNITSFGAFIRRYKLDELPQLFNVFVGTMSIVGPRPDVPEVIHGLMSSDKEFLKSKPGLISIATIRYLDEEQLLATKSNPTDYYLKEIWPKKVKMNLEYTSNWSNLNDLKIMGEFLRKLVK